MATLTPPASVTGSGTAVYGNVAGDNGMEALFQQQLTRAFERSSNLANYTPQQIVERLRRIVEGDANAAPAYRREIALAITRDETGIMALAAIVIFGLALRAGAVGGGF